MTTATVGAEETVSVTRESRRIRQMHDARRQEIAIAFATSPSRLFPTALELGAGDCYQSQFLKHFVGHLTCTDFDEALLIRGDPGMAYGRCDAEVVDTTFPGRRFDLIFSSNMLSHTPRPDLVLRGVQSVTHDDSLLVIVVPNVLWKVLKLALFYPLLALMLPRRAWAHLSKPKVQNEEGARTDRGVKLTNNPKVERHNSKWRRRLAPTPVGAYDGNWAEILGSRRSRWICELERAGWTVVRVARGPFILGDLNAWWNRAMAAAGLSTENIFIAKKINSRSSYERHFLPCLDD